MSEATQDETLKARLQQKHNQARVALDVLEYLNTRENGDDEETWKGGEKLSIQEENLRHKANAALCRYLKEDIGAA